MTQVHQSRSSPHHTIDTVWTTLSLTDGVYTATPDGSWDLISILRVDGSRSLFLTGQATEPASIPYTAGEESVVISFSASAYLQTGPVPPNGAYFERLHVLGDNFRIGDVIVPLPSFENAEALAAQLVEVGYLRTDKIVEGALGKNPYAASERSVQRHVKATTGLSPKDFEQIRRAQMAVRLLRAGGKPAEVALEAGYSDQAHMTRSMKKIMGSLPTNVGQIHKP